VSYIEDARLDDLVAPVFKLSDLVTLYRTRLEQLGMLLQVAYSPPEKVWVAFCSLHALIWSCCTPVYKNRATWPCAFEVFPQYLHVHQGVLNLLINSTEAYKKISNCLVPYSFVCNVWTQLDNAATLMCHTGTEHTCSSLLLDIVLMTSCGRSTIL
jgi:hypothetical protein